VIDPKDPNVIYVSGTYGSVGSLQQKHRPQPGHYSMAAMRLVSKSINASIVTVDAGVGDFAG